MAEGTGGLPAGLNLPSREGVGREAPMVQRRAGRQAGWMAGLALLLAGCGVGGGGGGGATLTVPLARWPGYAYFDLAQQRGLAKSFGLHLRTVDLDDPQQMASSRPMVRTIASVVSRGVGRGGVCIGSTLAATLNQSGSACATGRARPRCSSARRQSAPAPRHSG